MHIAFDGGCFQQGSPVGVYEVACGILNAVKAESPAFRVTLVCDPRHGPVRPEALAGLTFVPPVVDAPLAVSGEEWEPWPTVDDPDLRFLVDGRIVPASMAGGVASYAGPTPRRSFAVLSRSSQTVETGMWGTQRRGIRVSGIEISAQGQVVRVSGADRRLAQGFFEADAGGRWTDGAGFVPLSLFPDQAAEVSVDVHFTAQPAYRMQPGPGAQIIHDLRRARAQAERAGMLQDLAARLKADGCTAYVANHFTPIALPGLVNIAWAHDLAPILLPQYVRADARLAFAETVQRFRDADRVYAVSGCMRDDLVTHLNIPSDRVVVVPNAASKGIAPQSDAAVDTALAPLGLGRGQYILAVAPLEPRKNHLRLLMAYQALRQRLPSAPDLVFVGTMGWDVEKILTFRRAAGLEGAVKILPDGAEQDLACLYSGAMFSACVSLYEGSGLPILEAMRCGTAVLTSDRSAMAEIAGDAALLVDPYDMDAISAALQRLIEDAALRKSLTLKGIRRADSYSWRASGQIVLEDLARLTGAA